MHKFERFRYEVIEEADFKDDDDDDLAEALASLQFKQKIENEYQQTSITQVRPSVVDDFVRNFLIKAGLKRSLDAFNIEWYELQSKGKLSVELSNPVPDIYLKNEDLFEQTRVLREQVEKMREVAGRYISTYFYI
jgi:ribosomal protein L9